MEVYNLLLSTWNTFSNLQSSEGPALPDCIRSTYKGLLEQHEQVRRMKPFLHLSLWLHALFFHTVDHTVRLYFTEITFQFKNDRVLVNKLPHTDS